MISIYLPVSELGAFFVPETKMSGLKQIIPRCGKYYARSGGRRASFLTGEVALHGTRCLLNVG